MISFSLPTRTSPHHHQQFIIKGKDTVVVKTGAGAAHGCFTGDLLYSLKLWEKKWLRIIPKIIVRGRCFSFGLYIPQILQASRCRPKPDIP